MMHANDLLLLGQADIAGWIMFLVVVAVFVLPFVLGTLIGRALRVKDMSFRIGIVLFTAVLGLTPFVWQSVVSAVEQNEYEAALADWESRQISEAERGKFDQTLDELRQAKPELRIER